MGTSLPRSSGLQQSPETLSAVEERLPERDHTDQHSTEDEHGDCPTNITLHRRRRVGRLVGCAVPSVHPESRKSQHTAGDSSEDRPQKADTSGSNLWQGEGMTTWVVLLRGVNVGGANKLAMADLRRLVACVRPLRCRYLHPERQHRVEVPQHQTERGSPPRSAPASKQAHGLSVSAVLRTPEELRDSLAGNPFLGTVDAARVLITFLSDAPRADDVARLEPDRFLPDRFELRGSELYGYYPNGSGRSKMTLDYFEKRLAVRGTARNLNTVAKLIELADG